MRLLYQRTIIAIIYALFLVFTADNRVEASRQMQQKMGAIIVLPRDYRLRLEVLGTLRFNKIVESMQFYLGFDVGFLLST